MSIYNEILSARFNRLLQRVFSMKGHAPSRQLAGEVAPVFALFSGAENRSLEGWQRYCVNAEPGASAANTSGVRLRLPLNAATPRILVIERLAISETTADKVNIQVGGATTDAASLGTPNILDIRDPGSTAVFSFQNTAPAFPALTNPGTIDSFRLPANSVREWIVFEDQEIPLLNFTNAAGTSINALQVFSNVLNQAIQVCLQWRERALEESELR